MTRHSIFLHAPQLEPVATDRSMLVHSSEIASLLQKALGHKYEYKYKKRGKWIYVYHREMKGRAHEIHVTNDMLESGSMFRTSSGRGHFVVDKVEGDTVHFHVDETKGVKTPVLTMSRDDFKEMIQNALRDVALSEPTHSEEDTTPGLPIKVADQLGFNFAPPLPAQQGFDFGPSIAPPPKVTLTSITPTIPQSSKPITPTIPQSSKPITSTRIEPDIPKEEETIIVPVVTAAEPMEDGFIKANERKGVLSIRGISPNDPYLQQNKSKAQTLWNDWGLTLIPPEKSPKGVSQEYTDLLYTLMMDQLQNMSASLDQKALAEQVRSKGINISLETAHLKNRSEVSGEALGAYEASSRWIQVLFGSRREYNTFVHELTHALDAVFVDGRLKYRSAYDLDVRERLTAIGDPPLLTDNSLPMNPATLQYYADTSEVSARAMEQFLSMLGDSPNAPTLNHPGGFTLLNGYWKPEQIFKKADEFAQLASVLGFRIDPVRLAQFKQEGLQKYSERIDGIREKHEMEAMNRVMKILSANFGLSIPRITELAGQKVSGHVPAMMAVEYFKQGKYLHAYEAMLEAKQEESKLSSGAPQWAGYADELARMWVSYRKQRIMAGATKEAINKDLQAAATEVKERLASLYGRPISNIASEIPEEIRNRILNLKRRKSFTVVLRGNLEHLG